MFVGGRVSYGLVGQRNSVAQWSTMSAPNGNERTIERINEGKMEYHKVGTVSVSNMQSMETSARIAVEAASHIRQRPARCVNDDCHYKCYSSGALQITSSQEDTSWEAIKQISKNGQLENTETVQLYKTEKKG